MDAVKHKGGADQLQEAGSGSVHTLCKHRYGGRQSAPFLVHGLSSATRAAQTSRSQYPATAHRFAPLQSPPTSANCATAQRPVPSLQTRPVRRSDKRIAVTQASPAPPAATHTL